MDVCSCGERLFPIASRPAKLLPGLPAPWKHTFHEGKWCCAESDTLKASRSVTLIILLPAAQRSAGLPMLRSPRTGAWGAISIALAN